MDDTKTISDGTARRIASEWHGGQASGLCSFSTTGMIDDRVMDEVAIEINVLVTEGGDCEREEAVRHIADLANLQAYLWDRGHRTPVDGWSRVWQD